MMLIEGTSQEHIFKSQINNHCANAFLVGVFFFRKFTRITFDKHFAFNP